MNFNGEGSSHIVNSSSSSSSDEDEQLFNSMMLQIVNNNNFIIQQLASDNPMQFQGSTPGHKIINRPRQLAHTNLFNDYFEDNPRFTDDMFRRRFRMSKNLFLRICNEVSAHDNYFLQIRNAAGLLGLSSLQKITAAFRMLTYGIPADAANEYIKIGESTDVESLKRLCRAVVEIFGQQYLRSPNPSDVVRLLHVGKTRGFSGMLDSLDCIHWKWKNCPTAWAGQYSGRSGSTTIILEAVADYDLWIWHAYFGLPGSNNDINVLESSHLFANLTQGITPPAHYVIQRKEYDTGYHLADGIYPKWSTLVQTIHDPRGPKKKLFAMKHESCRKDVERPFGVLQSRFAIVAGPSRFWNTCIIMHNMIIEDERDLNAPIEENFEVPTPEVETIVNDENVRFQQFLGRYKKIRNKDAHIALRDALIEHLWEEYTNSEN